jgi:hypothetical protein
MSTSSNAVRSRRPATTWLALGTALTLVVALLSDEAAAHPDGKGDQHTTDGDGQYSESFGVRVLGHANPGGFNADVVAHGRYAYLASWGNPAGNFEEGELTGQAPFCPSQGVRVFDLQNPRNPKLAATFADASDGEGLEGAWTEKVIVADVDTDAFTGTLAAVSAQICDVQEGTDALGGFALYDVTDPTDPQLLSTVDSVVQAPGDGSHEIWLEARDGEAYVYTAEILQELNSGDPEADEPGTPDLRIFDVSDPENPEWVGDWGVWNDEGTMPLAPDTDGVQRTRFVHSVIVEDEVAYVSYWDRGTVLLDVSDPSSPTKISSVDVPTEGLWSRGSMHSTWLADGGDLLIEGPEVFNPFPDDGSNQEQAFGYPRFTDISDPGAPEVVGGFEMDTTRMDPEDLPTGFWTTHDPKVRPGLPGEDDLVYFSWYAEGVPIVDIDAAIEASDPAAGMTAGEQDALVAQFVPEPAEDPFAFFGPPGVAFPNVWGVYLHEDFRDRRPFQRYALASDINSGLWVFQLEQEGADRGRQNR